MSRKILFSVFFSISIIFINSSLFSQSLKGLSLGGTTGLITTPTGRISWENSANLGFDLGYHFSTDKEFGENENIINATISIFRILEAGVTLDLQTGENETDIHIFSKYQIYKSGDSGMAIGGSFQILDLSSGYSPMFGQLYLVTSYSGGFMDMPAATSLVFGKTFNIDTGWDNQIDFSMGFDLSLFPGAFHGYLHWISEFANYSYSADSHITNANERGAFNTGLRINLLPNSSYKFIIDATLMDVFDTGINSFAIGGSFGFSLR
jgi:hypothetical protein